MKAVIESIAFGGKGVARVNNKVYFIPFTCPGEQSTFKVTKDKKTFAEGKLVSFEAASHMRRSPRCAHYTKCGGCVLQHIDYDLQCSIKKQMISDALQRIGKFPLLPIIFHPSPKEWHYRKHIRLNLKKKKTGYIAGYFGYNPNQFIEISECHISQHPKSFFLELQKDLLALENTGIENCTLRIFASNTTPILAFSSTPKIPCNAKRWAEKRASNTILFKAPGISSSFGIIPPGCNPYGFTQCNDDVASILYKHIQAQLHKSMSILDLYGGSGQLALTLVTQGKQVVLVEANKQSCQEASFNAQKKGLTLTIVPKKVEEYSFEKQFDTALINPPREGMSTIALNKLAFHKISQIIYTSCMPSTLARDLKHLCEKGYAIDTIHSFDMFPQTTHIETVVVLYEQNSKQKSAK